MRKNTAEDIAKAMQNINDKIGYDSGFVFSVVEEWGDYGILISKGDLQDSPIFNIEELLACIIL